MLGKIFKLFTVITHTNLVSFIAQNVLAWLNSLTPLRRLFHLIQNWQDFLLDQRSIVKKKKRCQWGIFTMHDAAGTLQPILSLLMNRTHGCLKDNLCHLYLHQQIDTRNESPTIHDKDQTNKRIKNTGISLFPSMGYFLVLEVITSCRH